MRSIREQIAMELRYAAKVGDERSFVLADAILARFDVTPKPVISDEALGRLVQQAELCCGPGTMCLSGERMRLALDRAGLEIVRKETGER